MPIGIDWPEVIYKEPETAFRIIVDETPELRLYETDIPLIESVEEGEIRFNLTSRETSVEFVLSLFEKTGAKDYRFSTVGDRSVSEADSIQFKVITELKKGDYEIIFDDDDSGEAADVVDIRVRDNRIEIDFFHCKFSNEDFAGGRIKDLYEVCGQAQKSVRWMENPPELFGHLLRREPRKEKGFEATRFERGDRDTLFRVKEMSRLLPVDLKVYVVQPGLSVKKASFEQLELLSVTENYLMETYKLPFGVIANA